MRSSNRRKDGGAWRRTSRLVSLNAKPGKDRAKARRKDHSRKKANKKVEYVARPLPAEIFCFDELKLFNKGVC